MLKTVHRSRILLTPGRNRQEFRGAPKALVNFYRQKSTYILLMNSQMLF